MSAIAEVPKFAEVPLTDAFTAFITAAGRLEHSHRELHEEVRQLRTQLEDRNRALAVSVLEVDRMRVALRDILDALPCGVAVFEGSGQLVLLNPEALRLLGISPTEKSQLKDFPEPIRSMISSAAQATGQEDEIEFSVETAEITRWLAVRYTGMSFAPNESGTPSSRTVLIIRDVTVQKQIEQERESSRHMLALAEVATVLAHEIRNPLGSLELIAGLLAKQSTLDSQSGEWIKHLQAGIRSLSATVNNVLLVHSLGTFRLTSVNLGRALKDAVEFVRPLVEQAGIKLRISDKLPETTITGDAVALQQVVLNLACNAIRHTPANGTITVASNIEPGLNGNVAAIYFSDTGGGIAQENLARVFEAGFSTAKTPGLGLAVCKRIVEQHDGEITVQSQTGNGTIFRLEFPIYE
jgi:signal transduction histidine kinase